MAEMEKISEEKRKKESMWCEFVRIGPLRYNQRMGRLTKRGLEKKRERPGDNSFNIRERGIRQGFPQI